ncbi:MAG TPA: glycosyltransferase family 4 protein [Woeseiaceae bacterium]|nr:glycosyltransferase family 4 protein [Woeseiaceae bacterium]
MNRAATGSATTPPIRVLCVNDDVEQSSDLPTGALLAGLHRAGIELTVVCGPAHPHAALLARAGIPMIDIPIRKNFDPAAVRALRDELARGRYDIVHTFNNKAISNVLIAARKLPVKIVAYRGIVGAVGFLDPMSWMRYLNPRIDRIVCVAEAVRRHFLEMRPAFLAMPPDRPVTIHKGHDLAWYTDEPADLEAEGIPAGAFVVCCVANYRPRKGIEVLVAAIEQLPGDMPAHLLLVGRMHADKLSRRIAASPAAARIHRAGFRKDAPALAAASDVFCLPSLRREGLARSLIEAMAYRVPPIVTSSGGSPELVIDGESGVVVPAADSRAIATAIEWLYRDPALRRRMGDAARMRIATAFRHEDTVAKTLALYASLATGARDFTM